MKQQYTKFQSFLLKAAATISIAVLVGCSTGVKLDTPIEDRAGVENSQSTGAGSVLGDGVGSLGGGSSSGVNNGQASNNGVAMVDLTNSVTGSSGGPANVGKIIYFDYDSYLVKPEYASVINRHVQFLTSRKTSKITVEGHTDSSGGREYNLALGQKRAEAVRRAMALSGLSESQIEAISFGKEKPADLGGDDTAAAKNRRAEISYR